MRHEPRLIGARSVSAADWEAIDGSGEAFERFEVAVGESLILVICKNLASEEIAEPGVKCSGEIVKRSSVSRLLRRKNSSYALNNE